MTTRKVIGRDLPNGDYVEITAEERDDSGTLSPGFSVTLTGWERSGTWPARTVARVRGDNAATYGGAAHDLILAAAPELAPLVTAHLADPDGVPMHAEANGWYFYSGESARYELAHYGAEYVARLGTPHERAARALSIPPADLPDDLDREGFADFVATLAPRWDAQARAARTALAAMIDGERLAR